MIDWEKEREVLGALVRELWIECAKTLPNPKPSHLVTWADLDEWNKEVDRKIGERIGQRDREVLQLLEGREIHCLGCTQGGFPRHPLYMAHGTPLVPYSWRDGNQ